jgi:arginine decarboxylase
MQLAPEDRPEELALLPTELADQHICNFSVFQSLLDHWASDSSSPSFPFIG